MSHGTSKEQVYWASLLAIRNLLRGDPPDFDVARAAIQGAYHTANNALNTAHHFAGETNGELAELRTIIESRCVNGVSLSLSEKLTHALDCRDEWSKRLIDIAPHPETPAPRVEHYWGGCRIKHDEAGWHVHHPSPRVGEAWNFAPTEFQAFIDTVRDVCTPESAVKSKAKPECLKCRTELAFEGDECGLCKEEA